MLYAPLPRTLPAALRDVREAKPAVRASAIGDLGRHALGADSDEARRPIVDALVAATDHEPVFVGGASVVARSFEAVETVRSVLQVLEQQYVMVSLVRDVINRGQSVAIGAEHGVEPLAACSVIVSPVVVEGEHVGTVGVLGPTRMNYPRAMAAVEVVSERLSRHLGEGTG